MSAFNDFGTIWIASSPITDNFTSIKKAIDAGAQTIVLKSVTSIATDKKPEGHRVILTNKIHNFLYDYTIPAKGSLHTRSTHLDCEMLTINKSNNLYKSIKRYSPSTKVVASLAPINLNDFKMVDKLYGDGIEISPRWYDLKLPRPYFIIANSNRNFQSTGYTSYFWKTVPDLVKAFDSVVKFSDSYKKKLKEKEDIFTEGMSSIYGKRPTLLKVSRQHLEMDTQMYEKMDSDGITYSNSLKGGITTHLKGVQVDIFNKGSICGQMLTDQTLRKLKTSQMKGSKKYISASGGMINSRIAKKAISYGAGSVQLCSAIYLYGFDVIKEISLSV